MSNNMSDQNRNLDSTKSPVRPSHEAVESEGKSSLDDSAMDSAKRAQNRIHNDEDSTPGGTVISK